MWQCPVCAQPLEAESNRLICSGGHTYDRAREGYFNLLLANQKRRPDPGDSNAMLLARREFLDAGWYQPLANELAALLAAEQPGRVLDVGCGEGYYLAQLGSQLPEWQLAGLDISRNGIKLAARRPSLTNAELAVASSKRIPAQDASVQALMAVFAPVDAAELQRVLAPAGVMLQVVPGPEHLHELKAAIYPDPRPHKPSAIPDGFELTDRVEVQFPMVFREPESLAGLLAMTPLAYRIDDALRQALLARASFTVQADFVVQILRKATNNEC